MTTELEKQLLTHMPEVKHVDDDGKPVFSLQELAEKFGVSEDEMERLAIGSGLFKAPKGGVHRIH